MKQDKLLREVYRDVERTFGGLAWFGAEVERSSVTVEQESRDPGEGEDPFWGRISLLELNETVAVPEASTHRPDTTQPTTRPPRPVNRRQALLRPLVVFATLNPGLSYVQGMNSLIAVFYWVFGRGQAATAPASGYSASAPTDPLAAEAMAFFALGAILSQLRDLYVPSLDQGNGPGAGLGATLARFTSLLTWLDPTVAASLESRQIDPALYCFRWLTTLFANEVGLDIAGR